MDDFLSASVGRLQCVQELPERRPKAPKVLSDQDLEVLQRGDEKVLNALAPQPTPACPLEPVQHRSLCEIALLEPLPASAVLTRRFTVALAARLLQEFLVLMAFEGAKSDNP
jgi:hypothetical protein